MQLQTQGHSRRGWRLAVQVSITALTLYYVVRNVPWQDCPAPRLTSTDGRGAGAAAGNALENSADNHASCAIKPATTPGIGGLITHARLLWVGCAFAGTLIMGLLLIIRWRLLMAAWPTAPSYRWCAVIWARSQVINLLPTSQIGGDLYRIERSRRPISGIAPAATVVACERLIGLGAMCFVGLVGGISSTSLSNESYCLVGMLVALGVFLWFALRWTSRPPPQSSNDLIDNPPGTRPWWTWMQGLRRAGAHLRDHRKGLALATILSLAIQLQAPLLFALIDRALGFSTPVWCYLVAIPAINLAQFVPIHIAGIGILEGGLWVTLGTWAGRTPADVLAISILARVIMLLGLAVWSLAFLVPANPTRGRSSWRAESMPRRQPISAAVTSA